MARRSTARKSTRKTPKAGPYIKTARAKKMPGKTVAVGGTQVIKAKGKKPLAFKKGGLHASLNVPQEQDIPGSKLRAAIAGRYGERAQRQATFYQNVLKKGQQTARKGKK